MATWAFVCTAASDPDTRWYVAQTTVAEFPSSVKIVRVRVKDRWEYAILDRSQRVEVQGSLIRDVVPTQLDECP